MTGKDAPLSYIELSKNALSENVKQFRRVLGEKTRIAAVVKANAYGHGMAEVAKILEPMLLPRIVA